MSTTVFLHVGLPKSGTSYVQRLLSANKEALRDRAGLLFPGQGWSDQVLAVRDVRDLRRRPGVAGSWDRLCREIRDWPRTSIVSMEWLCAATGEQIDTIVADLAPARVEVIFTVRDLGRTLPAAWQEFMQNQHPWSWEQFLDGVSDEDPAAQPAGRTFWAQQDLPTLLERWATRVSPAHTHVVTLPPPGADRDLLWQRLATVLGVDPDGYTTQGLGGNESLGLESAELMHRLNLLTREAGMDRGAYDRIFKHRLAKQVLAGRRSEESVLAVPEHYHAWTRETAQRHREAVLASGAHVVGDLTELDPLFAAGRQPGEVSDAALLEASLQGLVALGRRQAADQAKDRPQPVPASAPSPPRDLRGLVGRVWRGGRGPR